MGFEDFVKGSAGVVDERNFARSLKAGYDGWSDQYHPGLGASTGQPDMQFLVPIFADLNLVVPVELKTAAWDGRFLKVSNIRPDQIRWAKKFRAAGGKSGFLAGVPLFRGPRTKLAWGAALLDLDVVLIGAQHFDADEFQMVNNFTELFAEILND